MGMKFLNKKGWHTGSLRNIENVWKAEQKDEAEKRKLEELRKQIHEEKERDEFRQLQEQAGFAPRQERLEFLYDSGLSVGKTSNEGFSALQSYPPAAHTSNSASAPAAQSSTNSNPGALFEEKPQSANDSWRKLHSDPLLMIRQREQEALARIKNNPVKMAMIRKSVEAKKKDDDGASDRKQKKVKSKYKRHSSSKHQSDTENDSDEDKERKRKANHKMKERVVSDEDKKDDEAHDGKHKKVKSKHKRHSSSKHQSDTENDSDEDNERKGKANHKGKEHLVSDEYSEDRERRHTDSRKDHSGEKRRRDSPVNKSRDRKEDRSHLDVDKDLRDRRKDKRHSSSKHQSDTENDSDEDNERKGKANHKGKEHLVSDEYSEDSERRHTHSLKDHSGEKRRHDSPVHKRRDRKEDRAQLDVDKDLRDRRKDYRHSRRDYGIENHGSPVKEKARKDEGCQRLDVDKDLRDKPSSSSHSDIKHAALPPKPESHRRRGKAPQVSEEERAARLREMQTDAEIHEENRCKRLKKAEEEDAKEASKARKDEGRQRLDVDKDLRDKPSSSSHSDIKHAALPPKPESHGRRGKAPQLSEEERAARLREMQMDAEIHEENRWKRLKKAEEEDAKEASKATVSRGSSFLDAVQKSVYGAEKGGSATIEESVRRRSHFSQGRTQVDEQNAFRR